MGITIPLLDYFPLLGTYFIQAELGSFTTATLNETDNEFYFIFIAPVLAERFVKAVHAYEKAFYQKEGMLVPAASINIKQSNRSVWIEKTDVNFLRTGKYSEQIDLARTSFVDLCSIADEYEQSMQTDQVVASSFWNAGAGTYTGTFGFGSKSQSFQQDISNHDDEGDAGLFEFDDAEMLIPKTPFQSPVRAPLYSGSPLLQKAAGSPPLAKPTATGSPKPLQLAAGTPPPSPQKYYSAPPSSPSIPIPSSPGNSYSRRY